MYMFTLISSKWMQFVLQRISGTFRIPIFVWSGTGESLRSRSRVVLCRGFPFDLKNIADTWIKMKNHHLLSLILCMNFTAVGMLVWCFRSCMTAWANSLFLNKGYCLRSVNDKATFKHDKKRNANDEIIKNKRIIHSNSNSKRYQYLPLILLS